jgi:FtsZ-interacting cell division protein ZipA
MRTRDLSLVLMVVYAVAIAAFLMRARSRDEPGRPKYPEFSWDYLRYYLDHHEDE